MTPATLDLVIGAAFIHAAWNILLKRVRGGLSFIWFVSLLQGLVFAPLIAWVVWSERPRLGAVEWTFIVGSAAIHIAYYLFLQRGYRMGDISLVYPIARGSGPMFSSIVAILFLGERPAVLGILGIIAIGVGIFLLSGGLRYNAHPKMTDKYAVSVVLVSPVAAASIIVLGVIAVAHG